MCYKDRFKLIIWFFILYSVIDKDYKYLFSNMHSYKEIAYYDRSKESSIFLKRVIKRNIFLRSNFKKGIDHDLLLIQQKRNFNFKLNSIQNKTKNYELKLKNEYDQKKTF